MIKRRSDYGRNGFGRTKKKFFLIKKKYSNPYRKRTKGINFGIDGLSGKAKLYIILAILSLIALGWLLFFSSVFSVNNITINGSGDIPRRDIENLAKNYMTGNFGLRKNILIFSKSELYNIISGKFHFQKINISKHYFHDIIIDVEVSKIAAIWRDKQADKYYYLDDDGNLLNQIDNLQITSKAYPLLESEQENMLSGNKINLAPAAIKSIIAIYNQLLNNKHGMEINRFIVDNDNAATVSLIQGPELYFNLKDDITKQITKLDVIINEKLTSYKNNTYIDLRYGDRVYFR